MHKSAFFSALFKTFTRRGAPPNARPKRDAHDRFDSVGRAIVRTWNASIDLYRFVARARASPRPGGLAKNERVQFGEPERTATNKLD